MKIMLIFFRFELILLVGIPELFIFNLNEILSDLLQ